MGPTIKYLQSILGQGTEESLKAFLGRDVMNYGRFQRQYLIAELVPLELPQHSPAPGLRRHYINM